MFVTLNVRCLSSSQTIYNCLINKNALFLTFRLFALSFLMCFTHKNQLNIPQFYSLLLYIMIGQQIPYLIMLTVAIYQFPSSCFLIGCKRTEEYSNNIPVGYNCHFQFQRDLCACSLLSLSHPLFQLEMVLASTVQPRRISIWLLVTTDCTLETINVS